MNARFPTSSSKTTGVVRHPVSRRGGYPSVPERHLQAYLIARDAVRRVQRTSWLFDSMSRRGTPDVH